MPTTPADTAVAEAATATLAARGCPDLSVTPVQILKWRQRGMLPVIGDRKGGRGRQTDFSEQAPTVAADLAVALDSYRNIDVAVLTAFGEGSPIPPLAVQSAYGSYLEEFGDRLRHAWREHQQPRDQIPRRKRVTLPGRRDTSGALSRELLAVLLNEAPDEEFRDQVVETLIQAAAPGLPNDPDPRRRVKAVLDDLSVSALHHVLLVEDVDRLITDLALVVRALKTMAEYQATMADVLSLTGDDPTLLPEPLPTLLSLRLSAHELATMAPTPGACMAIAALALYASTPTADQQRSLADIAAASATQISINRALTSLAESLPVGFRPLMSLTPGRSPLLLASLSEDDREAFFASVRAWVQAHPVEAALATDEEA